LFFLQVLHDIMRDPQLGTEVSLGCVRTGCLLLSGQTGMALNVDVKAFHDMLFAILLELRDDDEIVSTALMCARLLLHERREVSLERVAAFVRRLCEAALRMQPHQAVAALFNVRALLHKYPKLSPLLDGDTMTATAYRPDVAEPEHTNALASPAWELALLERHYYPWVQAYAKHLAHGAPSAGAHSLNAKHARALPHEIFEALDPKQHGLVVPPALHVNKSAKRGRFECDSDG
jgi:nucleolar complex protein 3